MNEDPRAELDALTHALGALVRRRSALGQRSTPRPARPRPPQAEEHAARFAVSSAPGASTAPTGIRPAAQHRGPSPSVAKPAAPKTPRPQRPAAAKPLSMAARIVERATAEVAARAAACADLEALRTEVAACQACGLCNTRKQTVFGSGEAVARVLFIGEAPGAQEDLQGVPFVGPAGALLGDIIAKGMGLARADVYIANVLKCRPPENRDPSEHEKRLCTPFLDRQIALVDPEVIIPLGRHAACHVLGVQGSLGSLRGRVHLIGGRKVVPTFHPAYLLRSPDKKKECWQDIRLAMDLLGLAPPPRGSRAGGGQRP